MNTKINFGFVFQIVIISSLIIIYIFQWFTMITSPSLRTGTDFISYYSVARISQEYGIAKIYDVNMQQEFQEEAVGFRLTEGQVLLYLHVPYIIPILVLFVSKNYIFSFIVWVALMLSIYSFASFFLLKNITKNSIGFYFVGLVLFFPFFQSLLLGQDTSILFLGITFWLIGIKKDNEWFSAIGVAITSVRPHFCLLFLLSLLFYNPKSIWKYIFTTGGLVLLSFLLIGWNGIQQFIEILQISADGNWYGMNENAMFNLIGLISRTLPFLDAEIIRVFGWVGYFVGIIFAIVLWAKRTQPNEWLISISIILALFFAPHLHYHDLTLLVIPLVFLSFESKLNSNLLLAVSFILLIFQPLYYVLPYALYVVLTWWLWKSKLVN